MGKLEKIPAWDITKVRSKKEVIDEARTKCAKVHFAPLMDICHLKNAVLETKHQKYKDSEATLWKTIIGSYAVLTEQGSSASQMTAATVMDIISWLPGCAGQAADAYLLIPRSKRKMHQNYGKLPNRNVQTFGFVNHDTHGQNHGPVWKTQSFLLSEICMVILWQDGKGNLRKFFRSTVGRRFPIWNAYSYTVKMDYSYKCMWMT